MNNPIFETALEKYNFPTGGKLFKAEEIRDQAFVVLRGRPDDADFVGVCRDKLGITLPQALQLTEGKNSSYKTTCLWIAPDEFLAILPSNTKDAFLQAATEGLQGMFAAAVDNSGTYSYLNLSGDKLKEVLAKVTLYDTSPHSLPLNKVVGTVAGKSQIVLFRKDEHSVDVLVRFSFADYVWRLIARGAKEYHSDII
ncbi:MAG: sarcosine oxidase subunit gamma [Candidatus Portiera sp.]|nr:sarcosine oxidase subunit gamma [Portiera sp.]